MGGPEWSSGVPTNGREKIREGKREERRDETKDISGISGKIWMVFFFFFLIFSLKKSYYNLKTCIISPSG